MVGGRGVVGNEALRGSRRRVRFQQATAEECSHEPNTVIATLCVGGRQRGNQTEPRDVRSDQALVPIVILRNERRHRGIEFSGIVTAGGHKTILIEGSAEPHKRLASAQLGDTTVKLNPVPADKREQDCVGTSTAHLSDEFGRIDVSDGNQAIHHDALAQVTKNIPGRGMYLSGPDVVIADQCPAANLSVSREPGDGCSQMVFRVATDED